MKGAGYTHYFGKACPSGQARKPFKCTPVRLATSGAAISDAGTGLLWQATLPADLLRWDAAKRFCESLDLEGKKARLPTRAEVEGFPDEELRLVSQTWRADRVWTSTEDSNPPALAAWTAWLESDGWKVASETKAQVHRVRCVR